LNKRFSPENDAKLAQDFDKKISSVI
jgi:hypothetical protein